MRLDEPRGNVHVNVLCVYMCVIIFVFEYNLMIIATVEQHV